MQVTIEFSDDIIKTVDIDFAWELFYLYQQGAQSAGEDITESRKANWTIVENALKSAQDGDTIDFRLMGDIYYNDSEGILNDNID